MWYEKGTITENIHFIYYIDVIQYLTFFLGDKHYTSARCAENLFRLIPNHEIAYKLTNVWGYVGCHDIGEQMTEIEM